MPNRSRWPLAAGLAAGVALDALLGDPRRGHPVAAFGRAAAALEARDYADSRPRGAAHAAACVLAVAAPAALLARRTRRRPPYEAAAAALAVWAVTGARSLHHEAERIMVALASQDLPAARAALPSLCGRDPAQPGCGGDGPGRDRVGGREHLGRGGGAAAVGGGGRVARTAGLPRGQHPRRHGGLPLAPLPAVRLGLGPPGRHRQLGPGPGHRRAHDRVRSAGPAGPSADGFRPETAGEGRPAHGPAAAALRSVLRDGELPPQPERRADARPRSPGRSASGWAEPTSTAASPRPARGWERAGPGAWRHPRAIRLSRAVTVSATALAVLLALVGRPGA